jgi:hypothetical protein
MADADLSAEAAALIKRAAAASKKDTTVLTDEDIDAALRIVKALGRRPEAREVSRDLKSVERQLEGMRGKSMASAVETLMSESPGRRRSAAK